MNYCSVMKAVVSRHLNTLHLTDAYVGTICYSASALSEEYLQKDLTVSLLRTFCFVDLLPKSGLSDEIVPTDCWKRTSGISRFLYKFQLSNEKRRFLLVRMLNFVISNWSKVTILNTLNELVSIYVTLLPLLQPVWTPTRVTLGCLNGQAWLIWNPF